MVARAAEIAERYSIHPSKVRGARLQKRFKDNCRLLEKAYYAFSESSKNKEPLSAGAEWLLDNYHVVEEQVREIRRDLPKSYYKALPKIADSEWAGYPRVYQLACSFVSHTDASFDIEVLSTFVDSYQTKRILQIGEIWAVPIMLRLALVENLRRLAEAGLLARENRRKAESFCKLAIDPSGQAGAEMLIEFVNRLNQNVEVLDLGATHLLRRLRSKGAPALLTLQWLDQKLKEKGIEPDLLTRQEQQTQAADQISFGNTVTALKTIGSLNWREWFERVSRVDQVLAQDLVYKKCDFITRDRYRHRIELLARKTNKSEVDVSQALIDFCKEQSQSLSAKDRYAQRISHIGYYLIDEGRGEFGRSLSLSEMSSGAYGEKLSESSFALYLSGIILITLAISAMAWDWMRIYGAEEWQTALVAILVAMVASDFATHLVQWIVTRLVQPKPLPKLDFELGVPDECTTVVTVQTIVSDREALDRLIAALEIRFIGNDDKNIMFALLADLSDASSEILPGDRGLMNHASELINDLNRRYCQDSPTRFFVLFRRRLWNEKESRWMAYERKRGKISEFNRLLRGAADTSFNLIVGSLEALRRAKYVITLDSDTQLPPGSARKLIGTIAHPLNAAIFAEDMPSFTEKRKGVVVRGYGVLQPRVGITLESAQASVFASVMSGSSGLDPYTLTVSDVYQDLFGDGSYIGKGIYELDTFERALRGRVPDNALLSHDLFEGLFARTGLVTDVELFDEFPSRVHAYYKRQHRWIRGDWQLVPWIWGSIPDAAHRRYASPISALGRWKLIDNLRRSLVAPSLLLLLICMWLVVPGSHLAWLAALLLALSFSVYSGVVSAVSGWQFGYSLTNYVKHVYRDIKKSIEQLLLGLIFLPHLAFHNLHAILVTLWRVVCSKKHLLEWETASVSAVGLVLAGRTNHCLVG
ncbi:MAG: hypothetical protein DCC75_05005 [Proteobacteria bacterium]|nr:MAG: hypothetical protein DCC75_05005 [Pseudomonadota bacterium]